MSNPWLDYVTNFRDNLPAGVTWRADIARYVYLGKRFVHPNDVLWYKSYLERTGGGGDPFAVLMATLGTGAAQLIAHPLEYGSMFQDRAGTVPVTESGQLVGLVLDAGGGGYHAEAISDPARGVFRDVGGFRYIEYNGTNTAYQTAVLPAPGVDKAQVFAGLRKLSDALGGNVFEIGNIISENGSFLLRAPRSAAANFSMASRGTQIQEAQSASVFPAPSTNIITALGDISGDLATLRIDGAQVAQNTGDQGTGNYNPAGAYRVGYGSRAGTALFFNGRHYATLGPIVRFGTNATVEQIEAAEAYYTARTGL